MPELPTTFGKYYLTEKLATGGMAEIYLAKLIGPGGFERFVVIKQILPKLSGQRHFVDLFVAEAKTLVTLAHGNIVPVYELGVVDDTYFIAMDYIDGPTLYRLTETMSRREGRMEPAVAAWIAARMLDGLDYAHRKGEGVIHRDLSPRNVMLSRDGEVKLVDFGIAVTLGAAGEESHQSAPTGSFPYMSPEQVRREALTPQTDLFTVGVLLWEMLTGERLFARLDAVATLAAVTDATIPKPSTRNAEVPARLDELVMRALERERGARWPSAGDMLGALNKYLYSLDETPGPREVAALVARYCPPETRRLPTHLEAIAHEGHDDASGPIAEPKAGPSTAVIPRDAAAAAAGKRPGRHQTFATHVELRDMLGGDTAAEPDAAMPPTTKVTERPTPARDDATPPRARPVTKRPRRPTTERPDSVEPDDRPLEARGPKPEVPEDDDPDRPIPRPERPPLQPDRPPSRAALVLIGFGGLALAGAVVYMVFDRRDEVLHMGEKDAGPPDANLHAFAPDAPDAVPRDAPAVVPDAIAPLDAGPTRPARDAAPLAPRDAATRGDAELTSLPRDAGSAIVGGTATLKLGASPWAKIYIDGKQQRGQTPATLEIPAGHHEVRLVFDAESPPLEKTYSIDIKVGETLSYQAEFTP